MQIHKNPKWKPKRFRRITGKPAVLALASGALALGLPIGAIQGTRLANDRKNARVTRVQADRQLRAVRSHSAAWATVPEKKLMVQLEGASLQMDSAERRMIELGRKGVQNLSPLEREEFMAATDSLKAWTEQYADRARALSVLLEKKGETEVDDRFYRTHYPEQYGKIVQATGAYVDAKVALGRESARYRNLRLALKPYQAMQTTGIPVAALATALAAYLLGKRSLRVTKTVRSENRRKVRIRLANFLARQGGNAKLVDRIRPRQRKYRKPAIFGPDVWGESYQEGIGLAIDKVRVGSFKEQSWGRDLLLRVLDQIAGQSSVVPGTKKIQNALLQYGFAHVEGHNLVFSDNPKGALFVLTR